MKKIYTGIVFEYTALGGNVVEMSNSPYSEIYDNIAEDPFV